MKTKNNVQKTILRSIAVVVSFVLLSLTVSAQGFWKQLLSNSSFKDIALALVETPAAQSKTTKTEYVVGTTYFDKYFVESEEILKLEEWMLNKTEVNAEYVFYVDSPEASLEIEDWMIDEHNFSFSSEEEGQLELESWMVDDSKWES